MKSQNLGYDRTKKIFLGNFIYYVTPTALNDAKRIRNNRTEQEVVRFAIKGGVRVLQFRAKYEKPIPQSVLKLAKSLREITFKSNCVFIVNDDIELTGLANADGIHLGQDDISVKDAKAYAKNIIGRKIWIGKSTHNKEEIINAANDGVDYINVGPLFPTKSKPTSGLHIIREDDTDLRNLICVAKEQNLPFTVMGGIKGEKIPCLVSLGCKHFAMITEICSQKDVALHVQEMMLLKQN